MMVLIPLLLGCDPGVCGELLLGGGTVTVTLTPAGGEAHIIEIPGEAEPGADPLDGARLILGPQLTDESYLEVQSELSAAQNPCGDYPIWLRTSTSWSVRTGGATRSGVWLDLDLTSEDPSGTPYGYATDESFGISLSIAPEALTQQTRGSGRLSGSEWPYNDHGCPTLPADAEVGVEVRWAFDPEVQSSDVSLCY